MFYIFTQSWLVDHILHMQPCWPSCGHQSVSSCSDGSFNRASSYRMKPSSTVQMEKLQWYFQKLSSTSSICSGHPSMNIRASVDNSGSAAVAFCWAVLHSVDSCTWVMVMSSSIFGAHWG